MFQSICYTDPSLLKNAILNTQFPKNRTIIDISTVHSHTDFVAKYPSSNIAKQPQFEIRSLLENSTDLLFSVDYFLLYAQRLIPQVSQVHPRTLNKTIHQVFLDRNNQEITSRTLKPENFQVLVQELMKHRTASDDCNLENIEWGENYIKVLKPSGLYPILHYLYELLSSKYSNSKNNTSNSKIEYINIIDTEGKLFNEAYTYALIPILNRLHIHGVSVTHNHCNYRYDYRKWEKTVQKELLK